MEGKTGELIRAWKGEVIENANPIPNGGMYIPPPHPPLHGFLFYFSASIQFCRHDSLFAVCWLYACLLACF